MPIRGEKPQVKLSKQDRLLEFGKLGASYSRLKAEEKTLKAKLAKENAKLKALINSNKDLFDVNGKHKELFVPLGDGVTQLFIQLQTRESISLVDNIIDLLKKRVGEEKAENFIYSVEVLHDDALNAMHNQGLISDEDLLNFTSTKSTESLIIKTVKK